MFGCCCSNMNGLFGLNPQHVMFLLSSQYYITIQILNFQCCIYWCLDHNPENFAEDIKMIIHWTNINHSDSEWLNDMFQGPYTREDGFLGYNEICVKQLEDNVPSWNVQWDEEHEAPFMFRFDIFYIKIFWDKPGLWCIPALSLLNPWTLWWMMSQAWLMWRNKRPGPHFTSSVNNSSQVTPHLHSPVSCVIHCLHERWLTTSTSCKIRQNKADYMR